MPQLWEKHDLTDIIGQIEHAGAGDVELLSMCLFFFCGSLRCATFFWVDVHDKNILKNIYTYVCMYVCMVITYSRVWINRVRLPILLVVS